MAGVKRKSFDRLAFKRPESRHKSANFGLLLPDGAPDVAPAPPAGLLKTTRELWASFWASPVAQIVDMASDRDAIEHWIWCVDERARGKRSYRNERLVTGSMGQVKVSPVAQQVADLTAQIRSAEEAFGLTPRARLRLGIAIGDATRSLADLLEDLDSGDDDSAIVDLALLDLEENMKHV